MSRSRLLVIGFVAMAVGSIVSLEVYGKLKTRIAGPNPPGVKVVVAARDLQVGMRIEENDLKTTEIPLSNEPDIPPNTFHTKAEVVSRIVVTPIQQGDFISPKKLADRNADSGMTSLIPPGMRAFPLRANDVLPPGSPVAPGNRVDILLTRNAADGGHETATVLQDVRLLAIDEHLYREPAHNFQPSTITLLVSLQDAQKLALASAEGHIQLVLRSSVDNERENASPTPAEVFSDNRRYSKPIVKAVLAHAPIPQLEPPHYWIIRGNEVQEKNFR